MATLPALEVPDALLREIEQRALFHGISLEEQVVRDLARAQQDEAADEEALMEEIRRDREAVAARGVYLTDEFLQRAKRWGRE